MTRGKRGKKKARVSLRVADGHSSTKSNASIGMEPGSKLADKSPVGKPQEKPPVTTGTRSPTKAAKKPAVTSTTLVVVKPNQMPGVIHGTVTARSSSAAENVKPTVEPTKLAEKNVLKELPGDTANVGVKRAKKRRRRGRKPTTKEDFDVVDAWTRYWSKGLLEDWQRLCRDLGVHGDLSTKDKCKEAMGDIWVNIHDFLQTPDKRDVVFFVTERALADYTRETHKTYPRNKIEEGSPLELLMAHISFDAWAKKQAEEAKKKKHESKHPRKYAFVPPPETYEKRQKKQTVVA